VVQERKIGAGDILINRKQRNRMNRVQIVSELHCEAYNKLNMQKQNVFGMIAAFSVKIESMGTDPLIDTQINV
jgi:hypothetical protein